jgi:hypothetical protein
MKTIPACRTGFAVIAALAIMICATQNRARAGERGRLTIINASDNDAAIYVNGRHVIDLGARQIGTCVVVNTGDAPPVVQARFRNGTVKTYRISPSEPYSMLTVRNTE